MPRTVYRSPIFGPMVRAFARLFLRVFGWRVEAPPSIPKRCVVIAAPHTTNWDFPFALSACYLYGLDAHWMGKSTLFPRPFRRLVKWFGGIPVDRSQGFAAAAHVIRAFEQHGDLAVIIPPEGTRRAVTRWKRGFYAIAQETGAPVLCGFLDYKRKVAGFGPVLVPTGNYEADMADIFRFYAAITPRYPENFSDPTAQVVTASRPN